MDAETKRNIEKRMAQLMAETGGMHHHRKPVYRMERLKETEQQKQLYAFFRENGLKPYGLDENGEPDGYRIEAAFAMMLEGRLRGGITLVSRGEEGTMYIGGVALDAEARAHHLGSILLKKVIDEAKALQAERIYANLPLAPQFYMKQGFVWDKTAQNRLVLLL